jgi:hypothetical protein
MQPQALLHMTEQHIGELSEQIAAHRILIRRLASEGQDMREHEQILELIVEAKALALTHRHLLLAQVRGTARAGAHRRWLRPKPAVMSPGGAAEPCESARDD